MNVLRVKVILIASLVFTLTLILGLIYSGWQSQQPFIWKEWKRDFFGDTAFNDARVYLDDNLARIAEFAPNAAIYEGVTYLGCTFQFENATESVTWNFPIYWIHFYLWAKR